jgi:hypothetical protein
LEVTPVSFSEVFDLPVDGLAALSSISQGSLSGRSGSAGSVSGRKSGRRQSFAPSGSPLRLNGSSFFGESPLPTLTGRSSNSRDGLGSRGRDQRAGRGGVALSDGTVVGAAALSDAEPAAMASARMAGLFVRTPSAVARSRRGSRASGRSTQHSSQQNSSASTSQLAPAAARQQFFEIFQEKARECSEEGDYAKRPDSARNHFLDCSMLLSAVPVVTLSVRVEGLAAGGGSEFVNSHMYQGTQARSLRLSVAANDTIATLKGEICDRTRIATLSQKLSCSGTVRAAPGAVKRH